MISVGRKRVGSFDHACDALSSTAVESVFPLLFKKVRLVLLDHACDTLFSTAATGRAESDHACDALFSTAATGPRAFPNAPVPGAVAVPTALLRAGGTATDERHRYGRRSNHATQPRR